MRGGQLLRIVAAVAISACIVGVNAEWGSCGTNTYYYLTGTDLIINGTGSMRDYESDYSAPWYYRGCSVETVTVQEGVKGIGNYAFRYCRNLTTITLPSTLLRIGSYAFYDCQSLQSLSIPAATGVISDTFYNCQKLRAINVNEGNANYSSIDGVLFDKNKTTIIRFPCAKSESYEVPSATTTIRSSTFSMCKDLKSVKLPESMTSIPTGLFSGCGNLTSVTIPAGVTEIEANAFNGCASLSNLPLPETLVSIGANAFQGTALQYVVLPDSVKVLAPGAFSNCKNLTYVGLPSGMTEINSSMFSGCTSMESFVIPDGVTSVGAGAFSQCSKLSYVYFPKSLTSLGSSMFYGTGFKTLNFPARLGEIPPNMYSHSSLVSVVIPEGITKIGEGAFKRCESLRNATISSTVTEIGQSAFGENQNMDDIFVDKCNPVYSDIDGVLCSKDKKTLIQYPGDHSSVYTIPEGITTIGPFAFQYLSSWFWKINFSSTVTTIGEGAFQDNGNIKELVLPANIVNFGREAFFNTYIENVIYLGLNDPDPGDTKKIFFCTDRFYHLCVPINYRDDTFCDRNVSAKNSTYDYLRDKDNACYQAFFCSYYHTSTNCNYPRTAYSPSGVLAKRPAVYEWTSQRGTYCASYICDNTTGMGMSDSCNHTQGKYCIKGSCVIPSSSSSSSAGSSSSSESSGCVPHSITSDSSEEPPPPPPPPPTPHSSSSDSSKEPPPPTPTHSSSSDSSKEPPPPTPTHSSSSDSSKEPPPPTPTHSSSSDSSKEPPPPTPTHSSSSGSSKEPPPPQPVVNSSDSALSWTGAGVRSTAGYVMVVLAMVLALLN